MAFGLQTHTFVAFVKAVSISYFLSGAGFVFIAETPRIFSANALDILKFVFLCFFIPFYGALFILPPFLFVSAIIFLSVYMLLENHFQKTAVMYLALGTLIALPAGWFVDWQSSWVPAFFAFAGAATGLLFYYFDQVQPKRKLSPAQPAA